MDKDVKIEEIVKDYEPGSLEHAVLQAIEDAADDIEAEIRSAFDQALRENGISEAIRNPIIDRAMELLDEE